MTEHHVLALASGKGGVGKTMLSVAFANELSRGAKTLLFDLDFFNRGLSGLFTNRDLGDSEQISSPDFLFADKKKRGFDGETWRIAAIKPSLYTVMYEDLDKAIFEQLETIDLKLMARSLRKYIDDLATQHGFEIHCS